MAYTQALKTVTCIDCGREHQCFRITKRYCDECRMTRRIAYEASPVRREANRQRARASNAKNGHKARTAEYRHRRKINHYATKEAAARGVSVSTVLSEMGVSR